MVYELDDGDAITIDIQDGVQLTLKPGAGATITYSEVDGLGDDAHDEVTVDVVAKTTITPAWPYYRISVAGGDGKIGVV